MRAEKRESQSVIISLSARSTPFHSTPLHCTLLQRSIPKPFSFPSEASIRSAWFSFFSGLGVAGVRAPGVWDSVLVDVGHELVTNSSLQKRGEREREREGEKTNR